MLKIPTTVQEVINTITEGGFEAYLVGGAVRDTIIGKESKDYDICTNMPLNMIKELYPNFHLMKPNNNRNTGIMRINNLEIEISIYKGKSIQEDLSNRDFTINAIALDKNGNLLDPFNGQESLLKKEITLIDKTGKALEEDPLRILRGIRIAARMNFEIDENTHQQMEQKAIYLKNVAQERIYRELIQILVTDKPAYYIRNNIVILFQIFPELAPMKDFKQHNPWHIYDILEHTLKVLENTPRNVFLRMAALFHDSGKPEKFFIGQDNKGHFYGHPEASEEIFKKVAERLKMDKKTKVLVSKLIRQHDMTLPTNPEKIYEFLHLHGFDYTLMLIELKRADNKGQNPELANPVLDQLDKLEEEYKQYILRFNNLQINSSKIAELGFQKKRTKIILDDVTKSIVTKQLVNEECQIIEYINSKYKR